MFLNAGYFRAHMYTLVPGHIREDMSRIADAGTHAITVSVLEQDLFAARENLAIIHERAAEEGLKLYADISRWGGLLSGTPKVPSLWLSVRPDIWKRHPDGRPVRCFGPVASIFHPDTFAFFHENLVNMLTLLPFDGIFWNEPKTVHTTDHSRPAEEWFNERGLEIGEIAHHVAALVAFYGRLNHAARKLAPDIDICCFMTPDCIGNGLADMFVTMPELDTFGCDGRAWCLKDEDPALLSYTGKSLPDQAADFIALAQRHRLRSFGFVENIDVPDAYLATLDRGLPKTLSLGFDHLLYYYYGRSVQNPNRCMEIMFRHVSQVSGVSEPTRRFNTNQWRDIVAAEIKRRDDAGETDSAAPLYDITARVHLRSIVGLAQGTAQEREGIAEEIRSYQQADGTFAGGFDSAHAAGMAITALNLLNASPRTMPAGLAPLSEKDQTAWLDELNFEHGTHKSFCYGALPILASGLGNQRWTDLLWERVSGAIDPSHPRTVWCSPDDEEPWHVISAIYHVVAVYDACWRDLPHPHLIWERLIALDYERRRATQTLEFTQCTDFDYIWVLHRIARQLPERQAAARRRCHDLFEQRMKDALTQSAQLQTLTCHELFCHSIGWAVFQRLLPGSFCGPALQDTLNAPWLYRLCSAGETS